MYPLDISGQVFGRLVATERLGKNKHGCYLWKCLCECGNEVTVNVNSLRTGKTKSCGCLKDECLLQGRLGLVKSLTTHGKSKTTEHHIWQNIIYRCHNENSRQYKDYGGRGIKVCQRWLDSFENFLEDMGPRPSLKHTVDRFPDNNGCYCPENCRWATKKEQANNRRDNRPLTFNGITKFLCEWSQELGIHKATIHGRLRRGWSVEKTLTTPPKG